MIINLSIFENIKHTGALSTEFLSRLKGPLKGTLSLIEFSKIKIEKQSIIPAKGEGYVIILHDKQNIKHIKFSIKSPQPLIENLKEINQDIDLAIPLNLRTQIIQIMDECEIDITESWDPEIVSTS
jgi:hypothetical protein